MIEVLLLVGFTALLGGGVFTVWRKGVTSPRFHINPELDAPSPKALIKGPAPLREISPSVRAELDETPGWWDGKFHQALISSGAPIVAEIEGDIFEERSANGSICVQYKQPNQLIMEGCTCYDCRIDNL